MNRRRFLVVASSLATTVATAACGGLNDEQSVLTSSTRTSAEVIAQTGATARAVAVQNTPSSTGAPQPNNPVPGVLARPPREVPAPTSTSDPVIPPQPTTVPRTSATTAIRQLTPNVEIPSRSGSGSTATQVRLAPDKAPQSAAVSTATPLIRKGRPISYVAIGASDTVGVGSPNPEKDGWVSRIHQKLAPGSRIVNLGISGARLSELLNRQLTKAIDAKPDLVTVWSVVNDLNANVDLAAYERDLLRLIGEMTSKTMARVVVGNAPDLALIPAYRKLGIPTGALRAETMKWNSVIARVVARYPARAFLVDLYARSSEIDIDPTLVAGDDFHPSTKGYAKLADVFWEFMVANYIVEA